MSQPDLIGRYRVERRLGSGAFGVVWLAHDDQLRAPVAVKVMADNWAYRLDVRERFLAEARMLRKASSRWVVQVFDEGETADGRPYFVMEYADRGTVEDVLTSGPVPLGEALRLVAEAARGAAALHEAGTVHRDIKPSNVLLAGAGPGAERVLLADLGLAKDLAQASGLTVIAGSSGYMAPEQAEPFDGLDVRADVYSLGALLYHLLTGAAPGPAGRVVAPDEVRPGLPRDVRRAVLRALAPDRARRWPTALAFAEELERLADGAARTAAVAGGRRPRGRRRLVAAAGALLALAVAGGGYAAVASERPPAGEASRERVADASGRISVQVPAAWARQVIATGWSPGTAGLGSGREPGMTVAQDVGRWPDLDAPANGVFAGLDGSRDLAARVAALTHPGCAYRGSRAFSDGTWSGRVRSWDACGGAAGTLREVALLPARRGGPQVYVQIRQAGGPDDTDRILRGLRVAGST